MRQHVRHRHPELMDETTNTERVKERWTEEETRMLARRESELLVQQERDGRRININIKLHAIFPHRSLESVKGHRRYTVYKEMVARMTAEVREGMVERQPIRRQGRRSLILDPPIEEREEEEDPFQKFFRELEPPPQDNTSYNIHELYQICRETRTDTKDTTLTRLSLYLHNILPTIRPRPHREPARQPVPPQSRRKGRRSEYARTQKAWLRNRSMCIDNVIYDMANTIQPPREVMEPFWVNVFTQRSEAMPTLNRSEEKLNLWTPITLEEVIRVRKSRKSAPGPDGLTEQDIRGFPKGMLLCLYNLFMWCEELPECLLASRTIFIPKKGFENMPEKYRPITIPSVMVRGFHSILAGRLAKELDIDERQRGFRNMDGCRDNTFQLDMILRQHYRSLKPLYIASVDITKAFPSVSHPCLLECMRSFGVPSEFVRYIEGVYRRGYTILQGQGWTSDKIYPRRGVRQGDPLSPPIFNLMTHRLLQSLSPDVGVKVGEKQANASAYVDDLYLYAGTPAGLQDSIYRINEFLTSCGLSINIDKSFTLGFRPSGRDKKMTVDTKNTFGIDGRRLRSIRRGDEWMALGVRYNWAGRVRISPEQMLRSSLEALTKAPLKPQQRLFALKCNVIPKLYHQLALGDVLIGSLNRTDLAIRSAIRKWLNLPHDVPNAYIHSSVLDGGLGVPSLRWMAPLLRLNRLKGLRQEEHLGLMNRFLEKEIAICEHRLSHNCGRISSLGDVYRFWASRLYNSVDGGGLRNSAKTPGQHHWVSDGTRFLSGRDYINSCRIRISALPTRSRTSRGRFKNRRCRAGCDQPETLNHVLQVCHRTHAARIRRHDAVTKYVAQRLRDHGSIVFHEPRINTSEGLRKPDLLAIKDLHAIVVDAQVISEQFHLRTAHNNKIRKYQQNLDVTAYICREYGILPQNIVFTSATLNWKGVWDSNSASDLRGWGFVQRDIKTVSSRVLVGGLAAFKIYNAVTSHLTRNRTGIG